MPNPRPTVWVLKEQLRTTPNGSVPMDYTPAYQYGDVKFITDFDMPVHTASTAAAAWLDAVQKFAEQFDAKRDYIILTGQPLAIFLLGILVSYLDVEPRVLVWRREQGKYVPVDCSTILERFA